MHLRRQTFDAPKRKISSKFWADLELEDKKRVSTEEPSLHYEIADALGQLDAAPWAQVKRLVDHCARLPEGTVMPISAASEPPKNLAGFIRKLQNPQFQSAALALSHFLARSGGQHADRILPVLISYLAAFQYLSFSSAANLFGDEFVYAFLQSLFRAASPVSNPLNGRIVEPLLEFFNCIASTKNVPLLISFLRALITAGSSSLTRDQARAILPLALQYLEDATNDQVAIPSPANGAEANETDKDKKEKEKKKRKSHREKGKDKEKAKEPEVTWPTPLAVSKDVDEATSLQANTLLNLTLLSMETLRQVLALPGFAPDDDLVVRISDAAIRRYSLTPFVEVNIKAAQLVGACALCLPALESAACEFLLSAIAEGLKFESDDLGPLYRTLVAAVVDLSKSYPHVNPRVTESLRTLLLVNLVELAAAEGMVNRAVTSRRDPLIECLALVLKNESAKSSTSAIQYVVHGLTNQFVAAHSEYLHNPQMNSPMFHLLTNLALLLTKIATAVNDASVAELIANPMKNRVYVVANPNPATANINQLIVNQLVELALLQHALLHKSIVDMLVNTYRKAPLDAVPDIHLTTAILRLARGTTNTELADNLYSALVRVVVVLGTQLMRGKTLPPIQQLSPMGSLLSAIASVVPSATAFEANQSLGKLHRNLWLLCVRFKLVQPRGTPDEWFFAICQIAAATPVLLLGNSNKFHNQLTMELEISSFFDTAQSDAETTAVRKQLVEIVARPQLSKLILGLSFAQCTYLQGVFFLEVLRANFCKIDGHPKLFQSLFAYLADAGITSSPIVECVSAIVDEVSMRYLQRMALPISAGPTADVELERCTQYLIFSFCHREQRIRAAADRLIPEILKQFPRIFWSKTCLTSLLDLLEAVSRGCDEAQFFKESEFELGNTAYTLILPEDIGDRRLLLNDVSRLCNVWLKRAASKAPAQTGNCLQEYLQLYRSAHTGYAQHAGFAFATAIGSSKLGEDDASPKDYANNWEVKIDPRGSSRFVASLERKSYFAGEVLGQFAELRGKKSEAEQEKANEKMAVQLIHTLREVVATAKRGIVPDSSWHANLFKASALLISLKNVNEELLNMICWAPVVVFTVDALEAAVWAWGWLLAARPEITEVVMTKLADSWCWTVEQRMGLFSDAKRPPSPLAMENEKEAANQVEKASHKADPIPHRLWLDFIVEFFEVVRSRRALNAVYCKVLLKSLENPLALSILPSALGARVRLLHFALKFLHGRYTSSRLTENILRESIYACGLSWFYEAPCWYDPGTRAKMEEDVKLLIAFGKLLEEEAKSSIDEKTNVSPPQVSSSVLGSIYHTLARKSFDRSSKGEPEESNAHRSLLRKRRQLLTICLGNEIERITMWHNPLNRIALQIPDENLFSDRIAAVKSWREILDTAWYTSPRLAVHLVARIPNPKLQRELERHVRAHPSAVMDEPAAITHLATKANVATNIPELKWLLTWKLGPPTTALALLDKSMGAHPYLTKYAIRLLRSYGPDTIIFYIPQLMQVLRWDTSGQMREYLVAVAKTNTTLAHQITYCEDPKNMSLFATTDTALTPMAEKLRSEILRSFTSRQFKVWKQEFDFFEKVTDISGVLRPLPKEGTERRKRLREELEKIQINGTLYLPSNPNTTVIAINVDGAAPMQSAVKSPILVPFLVETRAALDSLELDEPESGLQTPLPPLTSRGMNYKDREKERVKDWELEREHNRKHRKENTLLSPDEKGKAPAKGSGLDRSLEKVAKRKVALKLLEEEEEESSSETEELALKTAKPAAPEPEVSRKWQACIFKVGDDVRQDMLALQIIDLFKRIFDSVGLDLYLFPYKVVATAPGCGIIECVPNAVSRDQLGKKVEGTLYEYFQDKYGPVNSPEFQRARKCFIQSMAAYSVVTFLLQIKDRHNGNILVDEAGHIIHIDFGFLFDIGPGGIKFERAPFKANEEMTLLLGSRPDAEQFKWFMEKCIQAFLAAREYTDSIVSIVSLMMDTDFPCWKGTTLDNLRNRCCYGKSVREAASFMNQEILNSFKGMGYFSSYLYDVFQSYTQGIHY